MTIAIMSVVALFIAVGISVCLPYNVGLISIFMAFVVGVLINGMPVAKVLGNFPISLFFTILGVTYMFGLANTNGTVNQLAKSAVGLVGGKRGLVPIAIWILSFTIAGIGPGAIPIIALLAPPTMILSSKLKISPFLMAISVANAAGASAMSPVTYSGIIAIRIIEGFIPGDVGLQLFLNSALINIIIYAVAYCLFGGLKLWGKEDFGEEMALVTKELSEKVVYTREQKTTLVGMVVLLVGGIVFKYDVGLLALSIGVVLTLLKCGNEADAIKSMPLNAIIMVCGVTILVGLLKETGGMDIFVKLMASISTTNTVVLVATFIPSIISVYSSTTGVCFPAFLPLIPGLAETLGANPMALASGMCMGSLLVDTSPLSTNGAITIAAATPEMDKGKLFNQLLVWGLSMSVIGAVASWIIFGILGIAV